LSEVLDSSYDFPLQTLPLDYDTEMCFDRARGDVALYDDVNGYGDNDEDEDEDKGWGPDQGQG